MRKFLYQRHYANQLFSAILNEHLTPVRRHFSAFHQLQVVSLQGSNAGTNT